MKSKATEVKGSLFFEIIIKGESHYVIKSDCTKESSYISAGVIG
jgi:hypothetical protein